MQYPSPKPTRVREVALRRGLTLLELVMVVSILAILTALVVPGMTDQQEESRRTVAKAAVQELRDVIANRYMQDMADTLGYQGLPRLNARMVGSTLTMSDTTRASSLAALATNPQNYYLPQLHFLFVNPRQYDTSVGLVSPYAAIPDYDSSTRLGWNGPYVQSKSSVYPDTTSTTTARFPKDTNDTRSWQDFGFTTAYGQPGDLTVADPWGSPIVVSIQRTTHGGVPMYTAYVVSAGPNKALELTANATTGALTPGDDIYLPVKSWK